MIRFLATIVLLLGIVAAAVFFLLENPDRFKGQIAEAVESASGYDVTLEGELSWRYWPPIAINAEQIKLGTPGGNPFIELGQVSVDIDLIPLITQQRIVDVNQITVLGGKVSLLTDDSGVSNWTLADSGPTQSVTANEGSSDVSLTSTLQQLRVEDLSITYIDRSAGLDYDIALTKFTTSALTSDRPFDFSVVTELTDNVENLRATIESTGQLQYHSSNDQYGFDELVTTLNLVIEGEPLPEISLTTKGQWRPSQEAIVLTRNDIQVSSANISSTGVVNMGGAAPRFDGVVNLQTADPGQLSNDFEIDLPIEFLQFSADMVVDPELIHMRTIEGGFDKSTFKGSATVELAPTTAISADIRIDALNATEYLTDASAGTPDIGATAQSTAASTDSELVPVDTLRETLLKTIVRIDTLTFDDSLISNLKVELNNDGEVLDLIANASGYDGKIVLGTNTRLTDNPTTEIRFTLDRLDLPKLVEFEGITGRMTANANLTFSGAMQSDLETTLTGKSTFSIRDGTLDVRPLKSVAATVDALRGKTSSVSQWPDLMPFDHMAGDHVFTNGMNQGQVFNAAVENLSITALGGVDLQAESLHYDVSATLEKTEDGAFQVSDQLSGIRWPLTCTGKITDSPVDLCFGKEGAISDLVTEIVKQDLERRGNDKIQELIDEKVPEEYKDITSELFKNLFK